MSRTSNGKIYHGEDAARTAGDLWVNGDVFVVETTGAVYVRTAGAWVAATLAPGDIDHADLDALQGGTTDEYYHLTSAQHTDLTDGGATTLHTHASAAEDSGWTNATPATNYATTGMKWSDAAVAKYRKLNGVVYLSGAIICTNAATSVAFTLPEGYRPAHLMYFNGLFVTSGDAEGQESISIETDGDVVVKAPFANNTYHLDGISFPV
jgi:hypothetical protein